MFQYIINEKRANRTKNVLDFRFGTKSLFNLGFCGNCRSANIGDSSKAKRDN